jgi:hypothetical protein
VLSPLFAEFVLASDMAPMFRLSFQWLRFCVFLSGCVSPALGQSAAAAPGRILYDEAKHIFHMDGADVSYVFSVNEKGEVRALIGGSACEPPIPFGGRAHRWRDFGL